MIGDMEDFLLDMFQMTAIALASVTAESKRVFIF